TYRPAPERLLKSWSKGTHLVFTGDGEKNKYFFNISNERPVKIVEGISCKFTEFTNEDSVGVTPATPKAMSVAVSINRASQLRNLRIMVSKNGIEGYNNPDSYSLGDDWDIGLHVYDSCDSVIDNVQIVGYWRVKGLLLTENDGSLSMKGNPEKTHFNNVYVQSGIAIRNSPQIDLVSNTESSVTFKHKKSMRITSVKQFKIAGSESVYTYSDASFDGTNITLSGISPEIQGTISVIRFPSIGNNFSGTVFENTVATTLDHTSGKPSEYFGLPASFALEVDGFPVRNLRFDKFKAQTTFDKGNCIFGDCRDVKITSSEFENGIMIAYNLTETQGYTGNLRFFASDLQSSVNTSEFKPRDAFVDNRQIKTEFTDGSFIIKNWRPTDTKIQWSSGVDAIVLRESSNEQSNGNIYGYHIDGKRWINVSGYNKDINISSRNLSVKNHGDDSAVINIFGDSGNIAIKGNFSPIIDNSKSLGAPSFRWAQVYSASGTISTSDETLKTIYDITQAERDAALEIKGIICKFRFNESINFKGLELSRYHFGVGAQTVGDILRKHGLNPEQYAFWCYDEWPDVWDEEVITEESTDPDTGEKIYSQYKTGNMILVKKAGGRYGIRYDELAMFILMAM
uniref:tail fiber domain-containing protein n=1 Tax=Escherichia coli TaxID=562 RepID=UPI001FCD1252